MTSIRPTLALSALLACNAAVAQNTSTADKGAAKPQQIAQAEGAAGSAGGGAASGAATTGAAAGGIGFGAAAAIAAGVAAAVAAAGAGKSTPATQH